jgi:hypothetical protein
MGVTSSGTALFIQCADGSYLAVASIETMKVGKWMDSHTVEAWTTGGRHAYVLIDFVNKESAQNALNKLVLALAGGSYKEEWKPYVMVLAATGEGECPISGEPCGRNCEESPENPELAGLCERMGLAPMEMRERLTERVDKLEARQKAFEEDHAKDHQ